jgi:hypothetical protein
MRLNMSGRIASALVLASLLVGCDKLGMGKSGPVDTGAPDEQQLQQISYMTTANTGPQGRKLYTHPEEAKTCADLELAFRWNRPPNVVGGPFQKKMTYLTTELPADLPKETEVFITAKIDRGDMQPSGAAAWLLKMQNNGLVQAIEAQNFWEKQQQESQAGGTAVSIVKPTKPGRAFCGQGVYQGPVGKYPEQNTNLPLLSMLFSMDRDK